MAHYTPDYEGLQPTRQRSQYAPQVLARDNTAPEVVNEATMRGVKLPLPHNESDTDFYKYKVDEPWNGAHTADGENGGAAQVTSAAEQPKQSHFGRHRKLYVVLLVAIIVILAIVIAVPVALLHHGTTTAPVNAAPESTKSTSGAYNGSGLATIGGVEPSFLYWQHFDGAIYQKTISGASFDGPIVQSNVRKPSPLTAETYLLGSDAIKHVVYIDQNNILQDIKEINGSGKWNEGTLGAAQLTASSAQSVGLAMIAQYRQDDSTSDKTMSSVNIYYGGQDGRLHEVSQNITDTTWTETFVFPDNMKGDSGISAEQPLDLPMNLSILHCSDNNNVLSWFTKETYPEPSGQWNQGAATSINILPNSNLGLVFGANLVFYQDPANMVTVNAFFSNHSVAHGTSLPVGVGQPQTQMIARYVRAHPTIWFQTKGDDVMFYQPFNDQWNSSSVDLG